MKKTLLDKAKDNLLKKIIELSTDMDDGNSSISNNPSKAEAILMLAESYEKLLEESGKKLDEKDIIIKKELTKVRRKFSNRIKNRKR